MKIQGISAIKGFCILILFGLLGTIGRAQESATDFDVELQAVETTTPTPAADVPEAGTFYSAQNPDSAPLPGDILGLNFWSLGGGFYVLDDRNVNYDEIQAAARTAKLKKKSLSGSSVSAMDDSSDDDFAPAFSIPTNGLWLQITNVANGIAYLNLMNATDMVYEVMSKEDLSATNWNIEEEVSSTNGTVMPFIVPELNRTNLFIWAQDWTHVTENGNTTPDWWFWEYFGTVDLSDTNLDSSGSNTLSYDYEAGIDPNVIQFSLQFTNTDLNSGPANGSLILQTGVPAYIAILVNDTNQADANWQPYTSTNVSIPLNSGDGLYTIQVGLRGLPSDARQSWVSEQLTLDTVAPAFVITNPVASTVSVPMIQLQGLVSASLSTLTYDVSNATGIVTNQTGYWQPAFYDTNLLAFTTNTFQCYDVPLTNGLNTITLHATDVAGNSTSTNFNYTLDYSGDTNPPVLSVIWPTNGISIAGSNVTVQAQIDDTTATVTATISTNVVTGLVERNGAVWFNDLPLNSGTNTVTITATDAAGNTSTTNLTVVQSSVSLTVNPLSSSQMNQTNVTVSGTIGDASEKVTVNGVAALVIGNNWTATNVAVSPIGTAALNVQINDSGNNPLAAQNLYQSQPAQVVLASYSSQTNYTYQTMAHLKAFMAASNRAYIHCQHPLAIWTRAAGSRKNLIQ